MHILIFFRYKTTEMSCYNQVWALVFRLCCLTKASVNNVHYPPCYARRAMFSCLPQSLWDNKAWILGLKPLTNSPKVVSWGSSLMFKGCRKWIRGKIDVSGKNPCHFKKVVLVHLVICAWDFQMFWYHLCQILM